MKLARPWIRFLGDAAPRRQTFPVPSMGDSITEGTVVELSKNIGDMVQDQDVLMQVETDKVGPAAVQLARAGPLADLAA